MAKFVYLFRNNMDNYRSMSPEQMQQLVKKWTDWKNELEKNGHIKQQGERLDSNGKVVRGKSRIVTDGPFVEVKDSIQGFLFIEAENLDHALELSRQCPIFETDGSVEIRPFV